MNLEENHPSSGVDAASAPDPDFVRNLEWQVRTAVRREGRFARPAERGSLRIVKVAVIVAVALIGGASATLAVQHVQQSRAAALYHHRAEIEFALAHRRVALIAARAERLQQERHAGLSPASEVERAIDTLARARTEEQLRRSELDEVMLSGRAADDSLAAPRVGGRDFVGERLERQRDGALQAIQSALALELRVGELVRGGFAPHGEFAAANAELAKRGVESMALAARIDLRRRFLAGSLAAARVELEGRRAAATARSQQLETDRSRLETALKQAQALRESGAASQVEVEDSELALAETQAALELARDELGLIDEELAASK